MDDLEDKPQSLIVHVGANDLTNDVNLLSNVKKIVNKTKKKHCNTHNTAISFSNIIIRKDRKKLEKSRADKNHLGIKKLHVNRKGNTLFAKNLLNFIQGN